MAVKAFVDATADLRPGLQHDGHVRLAHERTHGHVADRCRVGKARLLRDTQRRQRVRRLPGLRERQEETPRQRRHRPVAPLAGDLRLRRDADVLFDPVPPDAGRVVRRAAGHQRDGLRVVQDARRADSEGRFQHARAPEPPFERIAHDPRLFVDLALHVVAVVALVDLVEDMLDTDRRPHDRLVCRAPHADGIAADVHQVAFLEEDEPVRHGTQRQDVRGDEILLDADSDDERAAEARTDHASGFVAADDADRVGALEALDRRAHGGQQVPFLLVVVVDEMDDDLGVGLRLEAVARRDHLVAQRLEALDDAVVHEGDAAVGDVRMRVRLARSAVRGPARMRDPGGAAQGALPDAVGQGTDLPQGASAIDARPVGDYGQSRGVVAPVLEPLQALEQDARDVPIGDGADDSTHAAGPTAFSWPAVSSP